RSGTGPLTPLDRDDLRRTAQQGGEAALHRQRGGPELATLAARIDAVTLALAPDPFQHQALAELRGAGHLRSLPGAFRPHVEEALSEHGWVREGRGAGANHGAALARPEVAPFDRGPASFR